MQQSTQLLFQLRIGHHLLAKHSVLEMNSSRLCTRWRYSISKLAALFKT